MNLSCASVVNLSSFRECFKWHNCHAVVMGTVEGRSELEVHMGMGITGIPWISWDSHGNSLIGTEMLMGMGMRWEWEYIWWEWHFHSRHFISSAQFLCMWDKHAENKCVSFTADCLHYKCDVWLERFVYSFITFPAAFYTWIWLYNYSQFMFWFPQLTKVHSGCQWECEWELCCGETRKRN